MLLGGLLVQLQVCAQFTNNYWVWGDSATIDWSNPGFPLVLKSSLLLEVVQVHLKIHQEELFFHVTWAAQFLEIT